MGDELQTATGPAGTSGNQRAGDSHWFSLVMRNSRRGVAVFWILLWFFVAIVSATSALVATQFKETFRTSGISFTDLMAESRRQTAEKNLGLKLLQISKELDAKWQDRSEAYSALLKEKYPFEQKLKELADLELPESSTNPDQRDARRAALDGEISADRPVVQRLEAEFRASDTVFWVAQERYDELVKEGSEKLKPPEDTKIIAFARDSLYLQNDFFLLRLFFSMPSDLVTLWLALCMGALGSVIYVLRELFDDDVVDKTASWFFMRPFLGMVLAFVMYLLIRTGQTTFTDPAGGPSALNPFTISFLAVISGLMSDRAYSRIVSAAENLLGPDTPSRNSQLPTTQVEATPPVVPPAPPG